MEFRKKLGVLGFVAALGGLYGGSAAADVVLSFEAITANSVADVAIGEAQLAPVCFAAAIPISRFFDKGAV